VPMKYWDWLAKKYINQNDHSPEEVHQALLDFDNAAKRNISGLLNKDIGAFKDVDSLIDNINQINGTISKSQEKKQVKADSDVLYSDSRYQLIRPKSTGAACYFGAGTKWCIAAREDNLFETYTNQGVKFVIIIDKAAVAKDPYSKVAIAVIPTNEDKSIDNDDHFLMDNYEIYDSGDNLKTIEDVWQKYPKNILQKINSYFKQRVVSTDQEEEKERIAAFSPMEIWKTFDKYMENLGYDEVSKLDAEKRMTANALEPGNETPDFYEKRINYIKYSLKKIVSNSSPEQIGKIYHKLVTNTKIKDHISPDSYNEFMNLIISKLKQATNNMSMGDATNFLSREAGLPIDIIAQSNLIDLPDDPDGLMDLYKTTKDDAVINLIYRKNDKKLKEVLTDNEDFYQDSVLINSSRFIDVWATFREIQELEPSTSFRNLPSNLQEAFVEEVSHFFTTGIKNYGVTRGTLEMVAERMYGLLRQNLLKKVSNSLGGKTIFYTGQSA
jgi:hypothetical protein